MTPADADHQPKPHFSEAGYAEQAMTDGGVHYLGQLSLSEAGHDDTVMPALDITVEAIEPAHYAPAGARPYEGTARRGIELKDWDGDTQGVRSYAAKLFPDSTFSYLGAGRHGVVMADETGKAFKFYRTALEYSRSEKDAGAQQLLAQYGLAPKVHLFVDAGEQYRLDRKSHGYTKFGFEDVPIPRQNSGHELPVMIMDKIDIAPLETAEPAKFIDGFCKTAEVFMMHNIHAWDGEASINQQTGDVIFIDVGEFSQKPFDAESATPEAKLRNDLEILSAVSLEFGLNHHEYRIAAAYEQGGLDAVRDLLPQLMGRA
jgi:hypothetical protein